MSKTKSQKNSEKLKWILEIVIGVSSVIAIILSLTAILVSQKANEIAQKANSPEFILSDIQSFAIVIPAKDSYNGQQLGACRTSIRLNNIGGAGTSLLSVNAKFNINETVSMDVSISDRPQLNVDSTSLFIIVRDENIPDLEDETKEDFKWKSPPAITIADHSATDLVVDFLVWADESVYILEDGSFMYPDLSRNVSTIEFTLEFPDAEKITTRPVSCFLITKK